MTRFSICKFLLIFAFSLNLITSPAMALTDKEEMVGQTRAYPQAVASATGPRTSPFEPSKVSDSTFIVDDDPYLDTGCSYRSNGPLLITFPIPRVIGDVNKLVQNGILGAEATLRIPVYDIDVNGSPSEVDKIFFNGHALSPASLTGNNGIWTLNLFKIPVTWINFPSDPGAGNTAIPANNIIRIDIDTASGTQEKWCMSADWVELRLDISAVPVVFVHGLNSGGDTWASSDLRTQVTNLGLPNSGQEVDLGGRGSYASRLPNLINIINNYKTRWGVKQFTFVGHSRGGLDIRNYLDSSKGKESTTQVIQIATPNAGSPFADKWQKASESIRELSQASLVQFNQTHPFPSSVGLASIAGHSRTTKDENQSDCGGGLNFTEGTLNKINQPHDGVVPVASVYALNGIHLPEIITYTPTYTDSCHTEVHSAALTRYQVLPYIKNPSGTAAIKAVAMANTKRITANTATSYPLTFSLGGDSINITSNSVGQFQFSLPGAIPVEVALLSEQATFTVEFRKPDGTVVNPGNGVTIESEQGLFGNMTVLKLDSVHATSGIWTALYSINNAGPTNSSNLSLLVAEQQGTISGTFSLTPEILKAGHNGTVEVELKNNSIPLNGANVKLKFSTGSIALINSASGIYTGSINFPIKGSYEGQVEVVANGKTNYARALVTVIQGNDSIGTPISDSGVTNSTNGLYDSLMVTVPVTVNGAMHYRLTGELRTSSGKTVEGSVEADLTAGTTYLDLLFDGRSIYAIGENGPYTIENLILYSFEDGFSSKLIDISSINYRTAVYSASSFQHDAVSIDTTAPLISNATDSNGDGKLDQIQVDIPVVSTNTSNQYYTWTAYIYDSSGVQVSLAENRGYITPGESTIRLDFDASTIGPNAIDGPFIIGGFLLYGETSYSQDSIGTINTPPINQFAGFTSCNLTVTNVQFPDTKLPNIPAVQTMTLSNQGQARCVLTNMTLSNNDFSVDTGSGFPFIMEKGAKFDMSVSLNRATGGKYSATATFAASGGQSMVAKATITATLLDISLAPIYLLLL